MDKHIKAVIADTHWCNFGSKEHPKEKTSLFRGTEASYGSVENVDPENSMNQPPAQPGCLSSTMNKIKITLQGNMFTTKFFPPQGNVASVLTLCFAVVSVFLMARLVFGPIAGPGGTIFALLILILFALIGGQLIKFIGICLSRITGMDIRLPPLLGMLLVGILMKNVPYNFGQFGRAECFGNRQMDFVDSLHDFPVNTTEFSENFKGKFIDIESYSGKESGEIMNSSVLDLDNGTMDRFLSGEQNSGVDFSSCKKKYIGHELDPVLSRTLRFICLTVLLLMAGLELDPDALWNLSGMVIRATFLPCIVEAMSVAIFSHLILGFPWTVGWMLGFVLAAVSPAVIIPSLLSLSERGYGVAKGIPTLVIAACSADDVVAISGFGIFLGITFNANAPLIDLILHGPMEVAIGVSGGLVWGGLAQWIPNQHSSHVAFFRFIILFFGGLISQFGALLINYDGAGSLAVIIMAFVASLRWRKEGWGDHNPVSLTFRKLWIILEAVIFSLIGTEIQIDKIDTESMWNGILVLCLALILRMISTYFAVSCGNLNVKEKIFMAFAWFPKATVQAAIGTVFLDFAMMNGRTDLIPMGEQVLTLAVLSILITAPLGAIGILGLGPKLLSCDLPAAGQEQDLEENQNPETNQDQTIDPNREEVIDLQRKQDKFIESENKIGESVKDNDKTREKDLQELLLVISEDETWDGRGEKMKGSNE